MGKMVRSEFYIIQSMVEALTAQVCDGCFGWTEEEGGHMVGEYPVDLLWHSPVEAAQSRLHVGHRDVQLGRGQRAGERAVGVAVDHDQVGLLLEKYLLCPFKHLPGLGGMGARSDTEMIVRRLQTKLIEEDLGHLVVVVLASVDQDFLNRVIWIVLVVALYCPEDGSQLDKLRPSTDDVHDLHREPSATGERNFSILQITCSTCRLVQSAPWT